MKQRSTSTGEITDWIAVAAWMGMIFILSSIPGLATDFSHTTNLILRKLAHITEYTFLAVLVYRAVSRRLTISTTANIVVLIIVLLYAMTDEIHQVLVPNRTGTGVDVIIDAIGAVLGVLMYVSIATINAAGKRPRKG